MKILVALFSCIFVSSIYAQKVCVDRIEEDGSRMIMTTSKDVVIDWKMFYFGIKIYKGYNNIDWCLLISSHHFISESTEVLLKLGNKEIMYLPCNNVHTKNVATPVSAITYDVSFVHLTTIYPSDSIRYYTSIYDISPEIIDKIKKYGLSKIRISSGTQYYDQEFSSENRLGNFLVRCRNNIQKRLNKTQGKDKFQKESNIFDDF